MQRNATSQSVQYSLSESDFLEFPEHTLDAELAREAAQEADHNAMSLFSLREQVARLQTAVDRLEGLHRGDTLLTLVPDAPDTETNLTIPAPPPSFIRASLAPPPGSLSEALIRELDRALD